MQIYTTLFLALFKPLRTMLKLLIIGLKKIRETRRLSSFRFAQNITS
jgi:hypothetical protein